MKLSILTMITKPNERQDLWNEALVNYMNLLRLKDGEDNEIIVVCGDKETAQLVTHPKIKLVYLEWKEDWDYIELPKHLNEGLSHCTGDWVLKLDIDHLVHESQFDIIKKQIEVAYYNNVVALNMEKISFYANNKYKLKGKQPILFKREHDVMFGDATDLEIRNKDLCQPINVNSTRKVDGYALPYGTLVVAVNSNLLYWNYSFTFKTEEVSKEHFWRFVRAYRKHFNLDIFGKDKEESWYYFNKMLMKGYEECSYTAKLYEHPVAIQQAIKNLKENQLGYNLWGKVKRE